MWESNRRMVSVSPQGTFGRPSFLQTLNVQSAVQLLVFGYLYRCAPLTQLTSKRLQKKD